MDILVDMGVSKLSANVVVFFFFKVNYSFKTLPLFPVGGGRERLPLQTQPISQSTRTQHTRTHYPIRTEDTPSVEGRAGLSAHI